MSTDNSNLARRADSGKPSSGKKPVADEISSDPSPEISAQVERAFAEKRERALLEIGRHARLAHIYFEMVLLGVESGNPKVIHMALDEAADHAKQIRKINNGITS